MTDTAETNRAAGDAAGVVDEFAHIPHSRGRHPVVAVAGALLAFFLVFHIRHDLRYALSSGEPLDLGRASAVFGHSQAVSGLENRYVRVAGLPRSGERAADRHQGVVGLQPALPGSGDR